MKNQKSGATTQANEVIRTTNTIWVEVPKEETKEVKKQQDLENMIR